MKNKGFTLVELLGVVTILIVVLSMAVIGYIKITSGIRTTYYKGQEKSILLAAGEYYNYNKDKEPKMFGSVQRVNLNELISGGYIENVYDQNKNDCDYTNSGVIAYRNSYEEIKYEVCLKCPNDKYESNSVCEREDYGLNVNATIGTTSREYREGTWTNQDVTLTFKTGLDVTTVKVWEEGKPEKSCTLVEKNGVKTCSVKIETTGKYQIVGVGSSGKTTEEQSMQINIDKGNPAFDINEPGTITRVYSGNSITITNIINAVTDGTNSSGVDGIIYSFEKVGDSEKYITGSINNNQINITKDLTNGKWKLKVELRDNAGNKIIKEVIYNIYKKVTRPTATDYCNNKIYNGKNQTYTNGAPTGIKFENTSGINAGNYTVSSYPKVNEYYVWDDSTDSNLKSENAPFICNIEKKDTAINWGGTTFTYNGSSQGPTASATGVNGETINISRTTGINAGTYTSTASCSSVSGGRGKCSNYNFKELTKGYTINKKSVAVKWGETTSFTYNGSEQAPTANVDTGVAGETMTVNRTTGKDAKDSKYTSTATCSSVSGGQRTCNNYTLTNNTKDFTISRASIGNPPGSPSNKTYNEKNQGSGISCPAGSTAGGVTSATDAGTYKQTCTPDSNHKWPDGTTGAKEITWVIDRAKFGSPTVTGQTLGYDNQNHYIEVSSSGTLNYSENGSNWSSSNIAKKAAGIYTIYVKRVGDKNHYDSDVVSAQIKIYNPTLNCGTTDLLRGNQSNTSLSDYTAITNYTYASTTYATVNKNGNNATITADGSDASIDKVVTVTATLQYPNNSIPRSCDITVRKGVARIGTTAIDYATIQAAVDKISSSGTVNLINNTTERATISGGKTININFNAYKVTGGLAANGTNTKMTLNGGSSDTQIECNNGNSISASGTSSVIIKSGNYICPTSTDISPSENANLTISGGTFSGKYHAIHVQSGSPVINISAGDFTSAEYDAVKFAGSSNVTISGGTFTGYNHGIYLEGTPTVVINNGTFVGQHYTGLSADDNSQITINNGNFKGYGDGIYLVGNTETTINNGTFNSNNYCLDVAEKANLYIYGGSFTSEDKTAIHLTGNSNTEITKNNVALKVHSKGGSGIGVVGNAKAKIDGGNVISDTGNGIGVAGTGSATISNVDVLAKEGNGISVRETGILKVKSGTFVSEALNGAYSSDDGKLTIESGTFTADKIGVYAISSKATTISGGTYTCTGGFKYGDGTSSDVFHNAGLGTMTINNVTSTVNKKKSTGCKVALSNKNGTIKFESGEVSVISTVAYLWGTDGTGTIKLGGGTINYGKYSYGFKDTDNVQTSTNSAGCTVKTNGNGSRYIICEGKNGIKLNKDTSLAD